MIEDSRVKTERNWDGKWNTLKKKKRKDVEKLKLIGASSEAI